MAPSASQTEPPAGRESRVQPPIARERAGRVLLVEDDGDTAVVLKSMLRVGGYEVDYAENGIRALDCFRDARYDLVLTDINMPEVDGVELLRRIREVDKDVPVVMVSAAADVDSAIRAVEYGALRYLKKPVSKQQLLAVAREGIAAHEAARTRRRAMALLDRRGTSVPLGLDSRFESALDKLYMSFQPIVAWSNREVVGYEALVRSHEQELGNPGLLFDAARRLNRIQDLSRGIRALAPRSFVHAPHRLFINVEATDLEDELLYDPRSPLAGMAERVIVEITERASLENVNNAHARIARLREMGYKLAIDDLGAGYAGLSNFGVLEPDICKLDMTLVRGVDTSQTKRTIVSGMVKMCNDLGIALVCEGVETVTERDALLELGCDMLQGYLFARPAPQFPIVRW